MAKGITILADIRREEHVKSLRELSNRDLCEIVHAHFESHPALPGEKIVKDQVNQVLSTMDDITQQALSSKSGENPLTAADVAAMNKNVLSPDEREGLIHVYAKTRIRETSLKEGNYYLDFRHFDPTALKRSPVVELPQNNGQSTIFVDRVKVELQNNGAGEVYVLVEQSDGGHRTIGSLPDSFLRNNPMNVEHCDAELQLADYSNGNMKNLSARVVVDTDLMSGDVVELDETMLTGLEQTDGLQQ